MFETIIHLLTNTDTEVIRLVGELGIWVYLVLFLIVFAETGLVVAPFLPGDSLLFAIGAVIALDQSVLTLPLVMSTLIIAGILGDALNYSIGKFVGPKVFTAEKTWLLNKKHLLEAKEFYEKHGNKTIILARFMPIVRTFAPFVAGIGQMQYRKFFLYNVVGAVVWVVSFTFLGYFFGQTPIVKRNFQIVIFAIVIISFMPVAIGIIKSWKKK